MSTESKTAGAEEQSPDATSSNNHNHNHNHNHNRRMEEEKKEIDTENTPTPTSTAKSTSSTSSAIDATMTATTPSTTATNDKPKKSSAPKPPKQKPSLEVLALRRQLQQCCKTNDLHLAMQLYQNEPDKNVFEAQTYYNLLNLCDGLGPRGVHIGTPKPTNTQLADDEQPTPTPTIIITVDDDKRQEYALALKHDMEAQNLALNETAYTALIRILSKSGQLTEAHLLLTKAEQTQQVKPRLRLYSALLTAHCDAGQLKEALLLWNRLHQPPSLVLSEREYASILSCATMVGDSNAVERIISDLAEDVLVPSHHTVDCITKWFLQTPSTATKLTTTSVLDEVALFPSDAPNMGPVTVTTKWTMDTSTIDDGILQTGCLASFALQPVPLSDTAWNDMLLANAAIVLEGTLDDHTSTFQGGGKGRKRKRDVHKGPQQWKAFQGVLEQTGKLDVVIDGANVGYYKQNFENAPKHVDYQQIDCMVQCFLDQDKKVLLVLHERHFSRKLLPVWAEPIVQKWKATGVLFQAPSGMNDDWFWLHAALWSGRSTLVVTNDEMRDHHFQMLAPRSFLRWKERHQIHFAFGAWNGKQRPVELVYPAKYSRRIQRVADGLVVPLTKRGDENRFLDGVHVANGNEPEEETYLCIRPVKN
jgi:pentatricopeptide repeat protein